VFVSKLWERTEWRVNRKYGGKLHQTGIFLFLSLLLLLSIILFDVLLAYIFHYTMLNTFFVTSFVLLVIHIFGPYYSSHMVNEERVFIKYAIKFSENETVTIFKLPLTPFLLASIGIVFIIVVLTFGAM
jgi:hypothetical protein